MNYRGKGTYQTRSGACVSVFTLTLILVFCLLQFDRLVGTKNPEIVSNVVLRDGAKLGPMNAVDMRFQFGFAWLNMLDWNIK